MNKGTNNNIEQVRQIAAELKTKIMNNTTYVGDRYVWIANELNKLGCRSATGKIFDSKLAWDAANYHSKQLSHKKSNAKIRHISTVVNNLDIVKSILKNNSIADRQARQCAITILEAGI